MGLILTYTLMLALVFSIPEGPISRHLQQSIPVVQSEGAAYVVNKGDSPASRLDNFTDSIMMRGTVVKGEDKLVEAMIPDYARYWHGYLVVLRPLMFLMNYTSIRMLYSVIILFLMMITTYLLFRQNNIFSAVSFILGMVAIRYQVLGYSMQYSNVFIITMVAMVLGILLRQWLTKSYWRIGVYFMIIGSVVNFVDFLTVPMVSFGLPLLTVMQIMPVTGKSSFKQVKTNILAMVISGILWVFGYAGTWLSKWLLASFLLHKNVVNDALNQILFRTEGNVEYPLDRIVMLKSNLVTMFPMSVITMLIIAFAVLLSFYGWQNKWHIKQVRWEYLLPVTLPFIWYEALANHSQIHYWMTYRALIITVLAIGVFLGSGLGNGEEKNG
ncbi:hypothetical protein [Weissella confusa]|uniref:hypothetical protein n=1 Tax=Weissella confusa TaxID=1583 RepID=UPI002E1AB807|nr:hypothetical protein [Weissella confusa]